MLLLAIATFSESAASPREPLPQTLPELNHRLTQLQTELDTLPKIQLLSMPRERRGYRFHPALLEKEHREHWIQIDLEEPSTPDLVALIPDFGPDNHAIGFPDYFQVSLSNDPEGKDSQLLFDHSSSPFPIAQHKFLLIPNPTGISGRYLRLTVLATKRTNHGGAISFQGVPCRLSEILALKGEHNLALGSPVTASAKDVPNDIFQRPALTDGWFPLGLPVDPTTESPCEGYHSFHSEGRTVLENPYWVQVDLEEIRLIDQINLLPTNPKSFANEAGYGFPRRFKLEASLEAEFGDSTTLFDSQYHDFPQPKTHHLSFPGKGIKARYVRLTVYHLTSGSWNSRFFTLAELQVISNGRNISRHRPVRAHQSLDQLYYPDIKNHLAASSDPKFRAQWQSWSEEQREREVRRVFEASARRGNPPWGIPALVDGFSSRHRLMTLPEWLRKLQHRAGLESEVKRLSTRKVAMIEENARRAKIQLYLGLTIAGVVFLGCLAWLWQRGLRKNRLFKERLARDLHDDLSSDLCNMALISQLLESQGTTGDDSSQKRLRTLKTTARRSIDSLRDIIFLTDKGPKTWSDAVTRLQEIPRNLLEPLGIAFRVSIDDRAFPLKKVSPKVLRNIVLIYKEGLSNVCKHAHADFVHIEIAAIRKHLTIIIKDNGNGAVGETGGQGGYGLRFMKARAEEIGGDVHIDFGKKEGTCLTIGVPF